MLFRHLTVLVRLIDCTDSRFRSPQFEHSVDLLLKRGGVTWFNEGAMAAGNHLHALDERLAELGVRVEELVERFVRAGGPGGQHVNRTATAVQLQYPPSGIEVRAEGERSQLRNRIAAREQLIARIEKARAEAEAARIAAREKKRRQHRRPPPGARKQMVATKRQRGVVKRTRSRVRDDE